jgi:hypothetical protein
MKILTFNDNLEVVENTARLLNGPLPLSQHYWLPLLGVGWTSLRGEESSEVFRGFLLELVSEWMRCGKRVMPEETTVYASGVGLPNSDRFAWHAHLASEKFLKSGKIMSQEIDQNDPAAQTWLWRVYWDWNHRNKPNVWFRHDGQLYLNYTSPAQSRPSTPDMLPPFIESGSPYMNQWDESILWFLLFLNSRHAQLLDRCVHCDRYFVRKRRPQRGVDYKRGPNCGKCKGRASIQRTQCTRDRRKHQRVKLAADVWGQWKPMRHYGRRANWVAEKMNQKLPEGQAITGRWVTQHQQEIEAEVQRRNHAKS